MPRRTLITLALLLSALLLTVLPRSGMAAAAPVAASAGTASASTTGAAARNTRNACSLAGLVPARGSRCPDTGRLRRQAWGIPSSVPNPVNVVKKVVGGGVSGAIKTVALGAILGWVASGAESALKETAKVIDDTTSPQLTSNWFSSSYWRVAGIAALLTVPFLCAAAIHALVRSDLGLLTRAAFGYLPLSLLAVGIASQLTMLLLAGTDEMSSIVASASLHADGVFLSTTSVRAVAESVATGDPFVTFLAAVITVAATLTLWLELLVRNAAVYVIVLMLPLFFAAMVWPARRTLAIRAIETLIALILSKFAIVAVLSLGGSALGHSTTPGAAAVLTGGTLVLLAAFTPWALLRMLPLHEVASAAAGGLSHAPKQTVSSAADRALSFADGSAALGAAWLGRGALPDGEPPLLRGGADIERGSAADGGAELGAEPSWAEPVDADVAEPVTAAMSGPARSGDEAGSGTAAAAGAMPDGALGSEPMPPDSVAGEPAPNADSEGRWPGVLSYPEAGGVGQPLQLGNDLLNLANDRRLPAAGADDDPGEASAAVTGPPLPALEPPPAPTPSMQGMVGSKPGDRRRGGADPEDDEPPTPKVLPPELEVNAFGEDT